MSIRKRNEFLEGDDSDEELDNGYDSEAEEAGRGDIGGRTSKRRKLEVGSDEESIDEDEEDGAPDFHTFQEDANDEEGSPTGENPDNGPDTARRRNKNPTLKAFTPKQVARAQKAAKRSGVIYISRVPPFMKPSTLKHFLEPHAPKGLGRLFLTPEDHASHTRRVKSGGNKKKSFTDGWVEFVSKRDARIAVETLNGNIIGGKKGNFYHDDLWSMKYLKGFKWSHLTEQIANENAERAARMREEVRKTKVENRAFVEDVEKGKMIEGMKRKGKAKAKGGMVAVGGGGVGGDEVVKGRLGQEYRQKKVEKGRGEEAPVEQASRMQRLIF